MRNVHKSLLSTVIIITSFLVFIQPSYASISLLKSEKIQSVNVEKAVLLGEKRFIIELSLPCIAESREALFSFSFVKEYQKSLISLSQQNISTQLKKASIPFQTFFSFKNLFNGISVEIDPYYIDTISRLPGVKRVYGVNQYYLDRTFSIPAISAEKTWDLTDQSGNPLTGKGMIVGIIDTGVDFSHPDLGGGIGKKPDGSFYKVISGYDFSEMNTISFDPSYSYHGSHVAGIVAGTGEAGSALGKPVAKGVAPDASLISYKVFTNKSKSTGSDAILFSLEQAFLDKCDVVNLSLGRDFGWTEDPLAIACDRATEAGIIVVASAGNDGKRDLNYNLFPIHTPGTGLKAISVASSDETIKTGFSYQTKNKMLQIVGRILSNSPQTPKEKELEIVLLQGKGTEDDFKKIEVKDKVVLMKRGDVSFQEKNENAKKAGAKAIVVYNYTTGLFSGTLEKKDDNIPMLSIDKISGETLASFLEKNTLMIHFKDFSNLSTMSSFSSEGPTPDYYLKPDLSAPGSNILSSIPNSAYTYMSGTSMSAPHVSGAAAILKQLHPDFKPEEIKSLLVNYTDILKDPSVDETYSLYLQGSGRLNLLSSAKGTLVCSPVSISLKEIEKMICATEKVFSFTITNKSKIEQTLTLSAEVFQTKNVTIDFENQKVMLGPGETKQITGKLILLVDHVIADGDNQFMIHVISKDNPPLHMAGIFYYGEVKKMDPILHSFCFPTLAISPNSDGSADSNELYFLTPYLTDGLEVDLFSEDESEHLGVLNFYRGRNGAGYFSSVFDGSFFGNHLKDGFYSAIPYVLPLNKDFKDTASWIRGKVLKMLIDRVPPEMELTVNVDLLKEFIQVSGKIKDNNSNFGLFCFYEIDNDIVDLISVGSDGTFKVSIPCDETYLIIKVTAQDLAGNTFSIKKRL
jgi:minor extracellular serine protease Vpr